jgi:hypothetical protein
MSRSKRSAPSLRELAISALVTALLLLLIEGLASFIYVARSFQGSLPIAESFHTRFDSNLGWANIPNVYIPDLYGPGLNLRINSQGFRADTDFAVPVPRGMFRVICSGDSFTLGYGVASDQTWPDALSQLDPRLQAVNMGQGGYGIDQAYLWYLQDGTKLNHDLNIFAFISVDFARMAVDRFAGYNKPLLSLAGNELVINKVPVQRRSSWATLFSRNIPIVNELRILRLLGYVVRHTSKKQPEDDFRAAELRSRPVALKMFEMLKETNGKKNSSLVLVYLPTKSDSLGDVGGDDLRGFLAAELEKRDLRFWDLTADFQNLPAGQLQKMFIAPGQVHYQSAEGHYTAEGNRFVAQLIYRRMLSTPAIANRLNRDASPATDY